MTVFVVYSWDGDPAEEPFMCHICATLERATESIEPDISKWQRADERRRWVYDDPESCRWIIEEWRVLGA